MTAGSFFLWDTRSSYKATYYPTDLYFLGESPASATVSKYRAGTFRFVAPDGALSLGEMALKQKRSVLIYMCKLRAL